MIKELAKQFIIDYQAFSGPVLVTGAGGCIGSWIVAMLNCAGVSVIAMDLKEDTSRLKLLMDKEKLALINWVIGDITDTDFVFKAVGQHEPQAIIHLAALQIPFCAADPIKGAKVNVVGLVNIMEAARKHGVERIAYASAVAAYGAIDSKKYQPTLYGAYKLCCENICETYYQNLNIPSIGLRPGGVYGVARDQGLTAQPTQAILAAAAGKPFTISFSGSMSALFAGEVAAAFIKTVSQEITGSSVYNICGSKTTVEDWMQIVKDLKPEAEIHIEGSPLKFPAYLDDDPLRRQIGDYGNMNLAKGTKLTFEAFSHLITNGLL
jgi:nucleoside-diphosphate-sugar epimerase